MATLGIISDTHIPDRARFLHPQVIPFFQRAGVSAILHAGDVSVPSVLEQLQAVAPVYAARGNRDWVALRSLPLARQLTFDGVTIGLTHGHGRWYTYLMEHFNYIFWGYQLKRYTPRLLSMFPHAKVIVFGHTHHPVNLWIEGKLFFNPGSPHFPDRKGISPGIGLLHICAGGEVEGELISLD